MLHALILFPYYFFGAVAALSCMMLLCRLLRVKVSINVLVGIAIPLSLAAIAFPLIGGWVGLAAFTSRPMIAIALVSVIAAAIDAGLVRHLPLPLDDELREL